MKWAQKVCALRCVFITPFGLPVVPPVAESITTSSMSTCTSGRVGRLVAGPSRKRAGAGEVGEFVMQIQSRILAASAAVPQLRAEIFWKNSTSQSNASSTKWFWSAGLRAPTGIQHMFARHRPSVQVHAITSFVAQTAPRAPFGRPAASRPLAIRQDSSPTSSKL